MGRIWLSALEKVSVCAAFRGGETVEIGARLCVSVMVLGSTLELERVAFYV